MADQPQAPEPGTPEFLAMLAHQKDVIEQQTGIRVDGMLDATGDDWRKTIRKDVR